jgi:hypothetical protein
MLQDVIDEPAPQKEHDRRAADAPALDDLVVQSLNLTG